MSKGHSQPSSDAMLRSGPTGSTGTRSGASFAAVLERLADVGGRLRRYVLLEGVARLLILAFAAASVQLTLDWLASGLQWSMRAALLVLVLMVLAVQLWLRVLAPLRVRFDAADAAKLIERRHPALGSLLLSAVRFQAGDVGSPESNSPALMGVVVDQAAKRANQLDFSAVLNRKRARRAGFASGGVLLLSTLLVLSFPDIAHLWFMRGVLLRDINWPKQTTLVVDADEGTIFGARGDDLVIQAYAKGEQPREVDILFETADGRSGRESMTTVGRQGDYRYRYTFRNAQVDFEFSLRGGDDRTDTYEAKLRDRPRVVSSELLVTPPAYSRLESLSLSGDRRAAQILQGSEVTFRVMTNHEVSSAKLMSGQETISEATLANDFYSASVIPQKTSTFHFQLVDSFDLENRHPVHFSIQVSMDEPPRVRMKLPGVGEMITTNAILPIELEFNDELGLSSAEWVHEVLSETQRQQVHQAPSFEPYAATLNTSVRWPIESEGLAPGDRLSLYAQAEDFNTVSGPGQGRSPEVTLRVVTADDLLAEMARREQQLRMDFERLIDAQEKLRSTLLTIAGQYTSSDDLQPMAEASASAERTQRHLTGSVNVVRQQFERILAELIVNQLATDKAQKRLGDEVIDPLSHLVRRQMPAAADEIRVWSTGASAAISAEIDAKQVSLLSQMRAILANMIQWEGYQEVVNMLRDILQRQQDLNAESRGSLEADAADVFEN